MALVMDMTTWLTGINIALVLALIYVYAKNLKVKSMFTVGLVLFAVLFLIENIVSFYYHITMMPYYADGLEVYALIMTGLQTLAFGVLNFITWR